MTQFQVLSPRGKVHYHEDIAVTTTVGGPAFDFSIGAGWSNFRCELKATDDHSGATVLLATVLLTNPPGADGLLDLDISAALTLAAQNADPQILEGIYDLIGADENGEDQLVMHGTWALAEGVTD